MIRSQSVVYPAAAALAGACALALPGARAFAADASFTPLGFSNPAHFESRAGGISDDGSVIVGTSGPYAVRWTAATGMVELSLLPGTAYCQGYGISADGNVLTGNCIIPAPVTVATRWIGPNFTPEYVGPNEEEPNLQWNSRADAVSGDGQVHVGQMPTGYAAYHPGRWDGQGLVSLIPPEDGPTTFGSSSDVSFDGSAVVGWYRPTGTGHMRAFRWTEETGIVFLGTPGISSHATAISPDGSIVAGWSSVSGVGQTGFIWTAETGMLNKGNYIHFDQTTPTIPLAVTGDGSMMVGYGMIWTGTWLHTAVIWDDENGFRNLKTALEQDYGLNLPGWLLSEAHAITPDGRFIVGHGVNPQGKTEAWLVELPVDEPACAPADLNCDGVVNVFDLLILLAEWGPCADPQDCPADLDDNGVVDVFDLLILLSSWG